MPPGDPRAGTRSRLADMHEVVLIGGRVAFSILSWVWIAAGIGFFVVITWMTVSWWNQGVITETTDLPPIFKWLFVLWVGAEATGAIALWKPLTYFFRNGRDS